MSGNVVAECVYKDDEARRVELESVKVADPLAVAVDDVRHDAVDLVPFRRDGKSVAEGFSELPGRVLRPIRAARQERPVRPVKAVRLAIAPQEVGGVALRVGGDGDEPHLFLLGVAFTVSWIWAIRSACSGQTSGQPA